MTQVKRVTKNEMIRMTGMDALGYSKPQNNMILVRKGLSKTKEKEVLGHEFEHIKRGEEGPFGLPGAAIIGGSLISGILGSKAAGKQARAAEAGIAEQRRQFDVTRADTAPWREVGAESLNYLRDLMRGRVGYEDFQATPGYQFRVSEGEKGLQNYLAGNKMRLSGRALKEMERFRQGTASGEVGNWLSRLYQLAGFGPGAVGTAATAGATAAGNIGNLQMAAGTSAANRYANLNQAIQGGLSNWMAYQQQQNMMRNLAANSGAMAGGAGGAF